MSSATIDTVSTGVRRGPLGVAGRLYYGQTRFDFVRRYKIWFAFSAILILAGVGSLATRGLNFDIEFVGGTSWQVPANGATISQAKAAITPFGLGGSTITMLGSGKNQTIQVEAKLAGNHKVTGSKAQNEVSRALARVTHHGIKAVTVQEVGPTWGSQITHKAVIALIAFFILISLYISIFFEWKMALAAIVAVLHDILVTIGIYSLSSFLVTPDTVVAFLTILGYSLYDTIVVFDRVRDNIKGIGSSGKLSFTDVVNLSMNQTLARSLNTSLVAILPILAVLILGADVLGATTLEYFGLALLIGLASGAYSSIFVASPLVALLKERESRWTQIRRRLESRGGSATLLSPAAVASGTYAERTAESEEARRGGRGRSRRPGPAPSAGPLRPSAARSAVLESEAEGSSDENGESDEFAAAEAPASPTRPPASAGNGRGPGGMNGRGAGARRDTPRGQAAKRAGGRGKKRRRR
jgi:preprotein translocase subunit SecF